jgi:hypothetical protein
MNYRGAPLVSRIDVASVARPETKDRRVRPSLLISCVATALIAGCVAVAVVVGHPGTANPPVGSGSAFDPVAFFDGHTHSWGVIERRSGAPSERVETDSDGEKNGSDRLRMVQHLSFQDGTTQQREWTLWRSGPDRFDATANDMVGTAKGEAEGNVFHWRWVLARSPGNSLMDVTMNQWMYRLQDGSVMIRSTVSKFGLIFAEVTEQFTHPVKG